MRTATIDAGEEHSQHAGQVYQEYYAGLRYYFLSQLGDASEADACARRTLDRFFLFMKGRCWEAEAENFPARILETAGLLCSEELAAKSAPRRNRLGIESAAGLLHKIMGVMIQTFRERLASVSSFAGRTTPTAARG